MFNFLVIADLPCLTGWHRALVCLFNGLTFDYLIDQRIEHCIRLARCRYTFDLL